MEIEVWFKTYCVDCGAQNWTYHGDYDNWEYSEIEVVKCWECAKKYWIDESKQDEPILKGKKNCERGRRNPR